MGCCMLCEGSEVVGGNRVIRIVGFWLRTSTEVGRLAFWRYALRSTFGCSQQAGPVPHVHWQVFPTGVGVSNDELENVRWLVGFYNIV